MPKVRPAELLQVGGPVTLAFLWCNTCLWEIDQAQLDKPPWSGSRQHYRCPGCGDALIRLRLREQGLELSHLVVGATPDNHIVLRSNGDPDVLRLFGEDLKNVADELTEPPEPGDTTH